MAQAASDWDPIHLMVRQALRHLDDLLYLRRSPLGPALGLQNAVEGAGEAMQQALIDGIQAMRPTPSAALDSPNWRRWRCLSLRYLEAASPERILQEVGVSGRQMRRDHLEAVAALAALLWAGRRERQASRQTSRPPSAGEQPAIPTPGAAVDAEVVRMGILPREGPVQLAEVLEAALDLIRGLVAGQDVRLVVSVPPDVRPVAINRTVLRQVLVALLSHAVEAAPGSCVEVEATERDQWVAVSLQARRAGTGEPDSSAAAELSRLTVSQQLVEMQGGTMEWRQDDGGRLLVDLRLPVAGLATVLVVDDNPDLLLLFERYLQNFGYRVIHASDGRRAIELARAAPPDVITLDLMMPAQDGWETFQQLRSHEDTQDIPIIVCSVLREQALALSLGAADFLAKPITQQTLLTALEHCRARRARHPGSPADSSSEHQSAARRVG